MSLSVLFFEVRGTRCALPVSVVREVLVAPPVTPVPLAPMPLRGLVPVHGQVLPLLDVGPDLVFGSPDSHTFASGDGAPLRPYGDQIVVVETTLPRESESNPGLATPSDPASENPIRAALVASRVTRLGTIEDGHAWRPPPGPDFVSATVLDSDGPALLLDAGRALEHLRRHLAAIGSEAVNA